MSRNTSHWRDISKPQLQAMLGVLRDLDGPATVGDMRRELERRGVTIEAIPTVVWEIGQNPGYTTSGGVRFPDGKWRYWLIAAPGWSPRWKVTADHRVVSATAPDSFYGPAKTEQHDVTISARPGIQKNEEPEMVSIPCVCLQCGHPLPEGHSGPPFCKDEGKDCKSAFLGFAPMKG